VAPFIWDDGNTAHIAKHGITRAEAEFVVSKAKAPYPSYEGDNKWLVRGQTRAGRYIQVIYVLESDTGGIDYAEVDFVLLAGEADSIYVIHARPLEDDEKRGPRRKRKGR
jgi:uncharacterized DUF497 family protein